MIALCASEKLSRGFIAAASLHLPNENQHISAFWAFHPHSWHCVYLIFFGDYGHLMVKIVLEYFGSRFYI
jgi:hypothetical protein